MYTEIYNASEGFFAGQLSPKANGMLLFLENGVFYEFVPLTEWGKACPKSYTIEEVEVGVNYAVVISTNAGLWRYALVLITTA